MSYRQYTKDELVKIKEMFEFIDKNKDGKISIEELKLGLTGFGVYINNKEINELKSQYSNCNYDDFVKICGLKKVRVEEVESKLLLAFSLLQGDKQGFVPASSIEALLKNDKVPDKDIEQIIREGLPDDDGNINYKRFAHEIASSTNND